MEQKQRKTTNKKNEKTAGQKETKAGGKRIITRNTIIIIMAVVVVLVIPLAVSDSLRDWLLDTVEEAITDDSKLSQTYNASRYCFRFGYPEDWSVENDVSGFGFYADKDRGIVVKAYPTKELYDTDFPPEESSSPNAGETNKPSNDKPSIIESEKISTVVNIFYREIETGKKVTSDAACRRFISELQNGLMYKDGDYSAEYEFGSVKKFSADNVVFYYVEYTCKVYEALDENTKSDKPVEVITGEIYAASRDFAYYAINFETDLSKDSSQYEDYHKDFKNIINDFRFSVFDD